MTSRILEWVHKRLVDVVVIFSALGGYIAVALSVVIFALGLLEVGLGAEGLSRKLLPHPGIAGLGHAGISEILKGLELLFLAPAVTLTYFSSVVFLKIKIDRLLNIDKVDTKGEHEFSARRNIIGGEMHQVKISFTGLMIAVLLTDLIGRIIASEPVQLGSLLGGGFATVLCLAYYLLLNQTHDHSDEPANHSTDVLEKSPTDETIAPGSFAGT